MECAGEAGSLFVDHSIEDPRLNWLYERIAELNEVDRSLTLLMLDGFSYREISEVLGYAESNVGVKLTRIRKRLTEILGEEESNEL
ncbi:sigma factor-like helix-turn-helix DNA-binding protein [Pelagicoccus sp. SDUM812002]|uniref:sigma factor-like helix-turn-helix DNA-binding protein n=1 Tax=Pelagicoccus sp. SDUM812002 TaxID=3041266 RepID=UPI0028116103|nr:sigma factor-like helix-turn-helix DNA-binding protein [Pelagicoccus sp. SDUM812002]